MQPSSVTPSTAPHAPLHRHTLLFWTLGALACVVAWDAAGQDLAFAQVFGSSNGFPMRDQWFFVQCCMKAPAAWDGCWCCCWR